MGSELEIVMSHNESGGEWGRSVRLRAVKVSLRMESTATFFSSSVEHDDLKL